MSAMSPAKVLFSMLLIAGSAAVSVRIVQDYKLFQPAAPAANPQIKLAQKPTGSGVRYSVPMDQSGHYVVDAQINGRSVRPLVDTGASKVALPYEEARRLGLNVLPSQFTGSVSTANGTVKVARVTLRSVQVGSIHIKDVEAMVLPSGALHEILLGMSFLSRAGRVEITGNHLLIRN